ncbi:MAG: hypothetical protein AB1646_04690 [Thermodesulfobacteriota bacterium]
MNKMLGFIIYIVMLAALGAPASFAATAPDGWGHLMGPVSGTVTAADGSGGVTVRSSPSNGARELGYLGSGTQVTAYNVFSNGWVQLKSPLSGGWMEIRHLEPQNADGFVTSVDYPEGCLRVRSGPSTSYPKVGCVSHGQRLVLNGIWSAGNWAQVIEPVAGWVAANQISSAIKPLPDPVKVAAPVVEAPTRYYVRRPVVVREDIVPPVVGYSSFGYPGVGIGFGPGYYYRDRNVAVGVGPGGVSVQTPNVGVGVGGGGVGVRVGGGRGRGRR